MSLSPQEVRYFILGAAVFMTAWGALADARAFRIPNAVCLGLLLLFPLYAVVAPTPVNWIAHAAAGTIVCAVGLFLYIRHWMGAGDVKLLTVLALWSGLDRLALFLLMTTMVGGVLSVALALKSVLRARAIAPDNKEAALAALRTPVPYGLAIASGGLCLFYLLSPLAS